MDEKSYFRWSQMSMEEKLPYLIDSNYIAQRKYEFLQLVSLDVTVSDKIVENTYILPHNILEKLSEFQSSDNLTTFFQNCDFNHDGSWHFHEYVLCRGYFDQNGKAYDESEFDDLENIIRSSFEEKMSSPFFRSSRYIYDEDGMIIAENDIFAI